MDPEKIAKEILANILNEKLSSLIEYGIKNYLDGKGVAKGDVRGKLAKEIKSKMEEEIGRAVEFISF